MEIRHIRRLGIAALALAALAASDGEAAQTATYQTDAQAEHYLEHDLRSWAGINLRKQSLVSAFCVNGYYSRSEQRTHKHYRQNVENRWGEYEFHSFSCTLAVGDRSFNLYVTAGPWRVEADR